MPSIRRLTQETKCIFGSNSERLILQKSINETTITQFPAAQGTVQHYQPVQKYAANNFLDFFRAFFTFIRVGFTSIPTLLFFQNLYLLFIRLLYVLHLPVIPSIMLLYRMDR